MKYLLDTDTLSALIEIEPPRALLRRSRSIPSTDQVISSVSLAELLHGAHRNREAGGDLFERIHAGLTGRFEVLPFRANEAHEYGWLESYLERRGLPIGMGDTMIAATALARSLTVVTGNVRHFGRVPGLEVENWLA